MNSEKWNKIIFMSAFAAFCALLVGASAFFGKGTAGSAPKPINEGVRMFTVDVKGEVKRPGTYSLAPDKRVGDAIELAGGLTQNADIGNLNFAAFIKDGQAIKVPPKPTPKPIKTPKPDKAKKTVVKAASKAAITPSPSPTEDSDGFELQYIGPNGDRGTIEFYKDTSPTPTFYPGSVDFNSADAETLAGLPGMTPELAQAVVDYREKNGKFTYKEEIMKVPGITYSIWQKFSLYIKTKIPAGKRLR